MIHYTSPVHQIARFLILLVSLGFSGAALVSCRGGGSPDGDKPLVVATTTMAADLARVIGGDRIEVRGLMGADVDPHSYIPRIGDSRLLEQADLVVYNGLHLEGRFQGTLEDMAGRGHRVVALAESLESEKLLGAAEDFPGAKDPHVWGDPMLWSGVIDPLVAALCEIDPEGADGFRERGDVYRREIEALDAWARETLAAIPREHRVLVTSHDAFHYFGRAYDLQVRGLQGISTASEAGLKDRAELVDFLRTTGIPAVFPESTLNEKGIATVATEAGVKLAADSLYSDALGKPGDTFEINGTLHDRGTYLGMIRHNVSTVARYLTGTRAH
jgi:manganese/zinc/iron transport system substrate-binding protein